MADLGITEALAAVGSTFAASAPEAVAATAAAEGAAGVGAAAAGTAAVGSSLPSLGTIGAITGGVGTLLQAKAGLDSASYQASVARADAAAQAIKANDDAAAGERAQIAQQRRTDLALSRAQAVAAGSGTDATSPDVLSTEGKIAQQGSYNALSSLYQGQQAARADNFQSQIDLFKASTTENAAPLAATGTLLAGLASFADKRARLKAFTSNPDSGFFGFGAT